MRASKKVKGAVLLTAGAALFVGAPTVYADSTGGSGGDGGNACTTGGNNSTGNDGILGGAQLLNNANLNIPVTLSGVGALLAGGKGTSSTSAGDCSGGGGGDGGSAKSTSGGGSATGGAGGSGGSGASKGTNNTRGNDGILGGLQVGNNLTANVPVTACGVGALLARAGGKCTTTAGSGKGGSGGNGGNARSAGGSADENGGTAKGGHGGDGGNAGSKGGNNSVNNDGILGGAQILNNADLNIPITLCGVALLAASAGCESNVGAGGNGDGSGGDGGDARVGGGNSEVGGVAMGGDGGDGGNGGSTGGNNSTGNDGILGGLQLLNNLDANVPVTVCGLAVLGRAGCTAIVSAGNSSGGDGGDGGDAVVTDTGEEGAVKGVHRKPTKHIRVVEGAHLPHTGAAGLALLPFGAALVAGGVALRRRSSVQR